MNQQLSYAHLSVNMFKYVIFDYVYSIRLLVVLVNVLYFYTSKVFVLSDIVPLLLRLKDEQTALHISTRLGKVNIVQQLLQKGATPNVATTSGYTPLHLAAREGHHDVAVLLLEQGASLSAATKVCGVVLGWLLNDSACYVHVLCVFCQFCYVKVVFVCLTEMFHPTPCCCQVWPDRGDQTSVAERSSTRHTSEGGHCTV